MTEPDSSQNPGPDSTAVAKRMDNFLYPVIQHVLAEFERQSRRLQWIMLLTGLAMSIPIDVLINLLTR